MRMKMKDFLDWIHQNQQWIFSGVGVALIGYFLKFLFSKDHVKNYIKAIFNYKSTITQINKENKEDEKK